MINDYDLNFNYHEGKANIVADVLSRKLSHRLTSLVVPKELQREMERLNFDILQKGVVDTRLSALVV